MLQWGCTREKVLQNTAWLSLQRAVSTSGTKAACSSHSLVQVLMLLFNKCLSSKSLMELTSTSRISGVTMRSRMSWAMRSPSSTT